jgi:hypothetical protein
MLIIGSTAMKHHFPDFRNPKDLDYFHDPAKSLIAEGPPGDMFWHASFAGTELDVPGAQYATIDQLYTVKVSHTYWELKNGSWDKHVADLMFLKRNGAKLDLELHKLLYPVWVQLHGKKQMNLAQSAGDFFDDAVTRIYDHDSIHDSVAYGDRPLYEAILKDGETVDIDPAKMWSMPFENQVMLFREEIAATALERWMIPTKYKFSPGLAWKLALKKTITSLTRGKSARFIVNNIENFIKPHDYMAIHNSKRHMLKPLDKTKKGMM